jgi:putative oxidoreductase
MNAILSRTLHTNARSWSTVPLRLGLGITLAAHGAQKLFGWFGGYGLKGTAGFFDQSLGMHPGLLWATLAGSGEFFGGLLVLIGLATRFASLTTAIVMAVAVWTMHAGGFFAPNGIELPLALLTASLALLVSGGGALSLDAAAVRSPAA